MHSIKPINENLDHNYEWECSCKIKILPSHSIWECIQCQKIKTDNKLSKLFQNKQMNGLPINPKQQFD